MIKSDFMFFTNLIYSLSFKRLSLKYLNFGKKKCVFKLIRLNISHILLLLLKDSFKIKYPHMIHLDKLFKIKILFSILILSSIGFNSSMYAQDTTTIQANSEDISDNLDLEAVASIFGESKDLEDFEKRLNDPKTQISNLDLNNDNEVDYLRVMELSNDIKNIHTISIQAVIGKDKYQEVATIDVKKESEKTTTVQVVGNVDMYGPNYCITPHYPIVPVFFTFFWMATYRPWYSPWYWGYHPPYFRPWHPMPYHRYHSNVNIYINRNVTYNRTNVRINNNVNNRTRNNDYFKSNPDKSFNKRNPGVTNRDQLTKNRKPTTRDKATIRDKGINTDKGYKSTGKPVTKPSTRPSSKPSTTKPSTKPSARPSTKPSTRPSTRPSTKSRPSSYSRQSPSRSSHSRTRH